MNKTRMFAIAIAVILICVIAYSIYNQIRECYLEDDPVLNNIRNRLTEFYKNHGTWEGELSPLNSMDIMATTKLYRGDKSYAINKTKVFICLKNDKGEYYPENFLIYVTLHEHSHCICDEKDHTPKFHRIFQALLEEASKSGIYDPNQPILEDYCENGDPEM